VAYLSYVIIEVYINEGLRHLYSPGLQR